MLSRNDFWSNCRLSPFYTRVFNFTEPIIHSRQQSMSCRLAWEETPLISCNWIRHFKKWRYPKVDNFFEQFASDRQKGYWSVIGWSRIGARSFGNRHDSWRFPVAEGTEQLVIDRLKSLTRTWAIYYLQHLLTTEIPSGRLDLVVSSLDKRS